MKNNYIFQNKKHSKRSGIIYIFANLFKVNLLEDNLVIISASVFILFGYVVLVDIYEENLSLIGM